VSFVGHDQFCTVLVSEVYMRELPVHYSCGCDWATELLSVSVSLYVT